MPTIELYNDGAIYVDSEIRERELIKQVPGTRWVPTMSKWKAPLSWGTCLAFRGVFGETLNVGPALIEWATTRREQVDELLQLRVATEEASLMSTEQALYPFQRVGVRFLTTAQRALIADDMGSGKTIQLIRALEHLGPMALPVLVVCPNSMKFTWKAEIEKWSTLTAEVVNGTPAKRRKQIASNADVIIINWEALRLHSRLAGYGSMSLTDKEKTPKELNEIEWGTVIADEAHRGKDPKAKQTRALWAVSEAARYRFAATGTPIESNPGEIWPILHFLSPHDFPGKTSFVDRYCSTSFNPFGGLEVTGLNPTTSNEFHAMVDPMMLRRAKETILPQLPPKTETLRLIPMEGKQKKAYDSMAASMLAELEEGVVMALNPLSQFIRLSQFASGYAEVDGENGVRLSAPSNKIDALMEIVEESGTLQVVAFAESKQIIDLAEERLNKAGITTGKITGDISTQERMAVMSQFQNGQLQVMLGTSAAAEGITLTAAPVLVFMQRFWSSIKNSQATDRIHRIGQEAPFVEIITLASKGTIDEYREEKLEGKAESLQEVLQDEKIREEMLKWGKRRGA